MRFALQLIACPIAVLAAYGSKARLSGFDGPFTASVWTPYIINAQINASGGKFYINKPTETWCPSDIDGLDCSKFDGSETVFGLGYADRMGLDDSVPGGQQVYIAPDGSLSFTQAHSAYIPPGSTVTGFSREPDSGYLRIADRQWAICPSSGGYQREVIYQIFAYIDSDEGCFGTEIKTHDSDSSRVWQYI
ncbi:hypothetical protein F4680DRAFT_433192 [Xylaria scruposa]|nr:hypothetical protein F4680DRAFT_433192 [Xylaria scruposa]